MCPIKKSSGTAPRSNSGRAAICVLPGNRTSLLSSTASAAPASSSRTKHLVYNTGSSSPDENNTRRQPPGLSGITSRATGPAGTGVHRVRASHDTLVGQPGCRQIGRPAGYRNALFKADAVQRGPRGDVEGLQVGVSEGAIGGRLSHWDGLQQLAFGAVDCNAIGGDV